MHSSTLTANLSPGSFLRMQGQDATEVGASTTWPGLKSHVRHKVNKGIHSRRDSFISFSFFNEQCVLKKLYLYLQEMDCIGQTTTLDMEDAVVIK